MRTYLTVLKQQQAPDQESTFSLKKHGQKQPFLCHDMRSLHYSYVAACMDEMPGKNVSVFTTVKREKFSCKSQTNYFKANRVFTFTAETFIHDYQALNFLKVCFKCSVFENRKRVLLLKFVNKILRGREALLQLKEARHFETCEGN